MRPEEWYARDWGGDGRDEKDEGGRIGEERKGTVGAYHIDLAVSTRDALRTVRRAGGTNHITQ